MNDLLQRTDEKWTKSNGEQNPLMGTFVGNLLGGLYSFFSEITVFISRFVANCVLRNTYKLDYSGKHLSWEYTGRTQPITARDSNVGKK